MARYLVVANQTLGGDHLAAKVQECLAAGPSSFHVVVPATAPTDHMWTEAEAQGVARARLDQALERFRSLGAEVDGEVGDGNPILAIEDAMRDGEYDEIILSTLRPGLSRWLKLDLPDRVKARFSVRVTHVIGEPEAG
ncbi:MAG: hypothetical protein ABR518_10430 [Actinomycetota bacterium]